MRRPWVRLKWLGAIVEPPGQSSAPRKNPHRSWQRLREMGLAPALRIGQIQNGRGQEETPPDLVVIPMGPVAFALRLAAKSKRVGQIILDPQHAVNLTHQARRHVVALDGHLEREARGVPFGYDPRRWLRLDLLGIRQGLVAVRRIYKFVHGEEFHLLK